MSTRSEFDDEGFGMFGWRVRYNAPGGIQQALLSIGVAGGANPVAMVSAHELANALAFQR